MGRGGTRPYLLDRTALLRPPELLFQLAEVHLDERGPAMRAGVGHRAMAQILDEVFQFPTGERVVGFHRMTADGLGHGMLA